MAEAENQAAYSTANDDPSKKQAVSQPQTPIVKRMSIRNINTNGTWRVKNKSEVDERVEELRQRLYKEIEENTVLNVEF